VREKETTLEAHTSTPAGAIVHDVVQTADQLTTLTAPVRVLCVDMDDPLPDLEEQDANATSYNGVLVYIQRGARVVGQAYINLSQPTANDELARQVAAIDSRGVDSEPMPDAQTLPRISVVIPTTLDRLESLERCLQSLLRQDYRAFEVVIVDNRPDGTPGREDIYRKLRIDPRFHVVSEATIGISAARNRGVEQAASDIIAFTDDDVEVAPQWLRSLAVRFAMEPETECVTGLVLPAELETQAQVWFERSGGKIDQRYERTTYGRADYESRFAVSARDAHGNVMGPVVPIYRAKFGMGANMTFRKAALRAMGGFDHALGAGVRTRGGEDIAMISQLLYSGGQLTFDPSVVVHHYHRRDLEALRSQMRGYGVGYTAALTALIVRDPRHLIGLLGMVVRAVGLLSSRSRQRVAGDFPSSLARIEFWGLVLGPTTYIRSRLTDRRRPGAGVRIPAPAVRSNG